MLLNLSNHPSAGWGDAQREAALAQFGGVVDLPFPAIDPAWSAEQVAALADDVAARCLDALPTHDRSHAVHLMGEMTFTHAVVLRLHALGVRCVASTTERLVSTDAEGRKITTFRFIRFRDYPGAPTHP